MILLDAVNICMGMLTTPLEVFPTDHACVDVVIGERYGA
jgi:hypothetical protein